ncbi:MAG TPA: hypothetical protein DCO77_01770 [Nitrospiraceae bacterium]|nr:hypothetical protein [Nitrospiraceae bacterium]
MEQLITFVVLIAIGYFAGTAAESRHYRSIRERERQFLNLPAVTARNFLDDREEVAGTMLVYGNVVVSLDYFKRILAGLRNIFGGEVKSYLTLIDRARREAVLRAKKMAGNADIILNLRIETSSIGQNANRKNAVGSIEVLAYGTAVTLKK